MDLPTGPTTVQDAGSNGRLESARAKVVTAPLVVAVAMLCAAACVAGPFASWMNLNQHKQPIALRGPLASLDEGAVAPYRVVSRHVLDPATLESLGTKEYLSWGLENGNLPPTDPLRFARLLVTYYSGGASLVPHTPDVCWVGGGYEPAQPHENLELDLAPLRADRPKVPVRVCTFAKTALRNRSKQTVVYTFHCNGRFVATRTGVRILVNAPTNRYAYFSKVEISFPGATRAQSLEGAAMLFARLLPALVGDHWPDFEAAEDTARSGA